MHKIIIPRFIFLIMLMAGHAARADFETDLADTGKSNKALREMHHQAELGDADAQLNMGGMYFKEQNYEEAAKWFHLAAQKGSAQAQYNLGMMYDTGHGVGLDHAEAVQWYRRAADQKLSIAQLNLGVAYAEGQGINQDEKEAIKWFRLAALQGEAQAQFNLGVMYANGQGVTQDLVTAYRYAKLAAAQGHETAPALLRDLTRQMSPEQLASANQPVFSKIGPRTAAASPESNKIYLQLGAFKSPNQAEKFLSLLSSKLGAMAHPINLHLQDEWTQIQVGPYASLSEAQHSAGILKTRLGFEPMIKRR
jgi:tetratricopeptide (TPR) repeat protein